MLHGGPGTSDYLDSLDGELASGYTVHRYQQRGLAPSTTSGPFSIEAHADDALAVLRAVAPNGAVVIGHSWGGYLGMHLAAMRPVLMLGLVVVDSVGGVTLQGSLNALAYRGRCVSVGDAGRSAAERVDISGMRQNNQTLSGYFLGAELFVSPRAHTMIARHLEEIARKELRVVVDQVFDLEQAGEAHRYIEGRQAFGRVLLAP